MGALSLPTTLIFCGRCQFYKKREKRKNRERSTKKKNRRKGLKKQTNDLKFGTSVVRCRQVSSTAVQVRAGGSEVRSQMLPCWFFLTRVMTVILEH
jgi:hypothetical protein